MRTLALLVLLVLGETARAAGGTVLVLYPDAPPPYQGAFEQMIAGIQHAAGRSLYTLALPKELDMARIEGWMDAHKDRDTVLVLLGQRALSAYDQLSTKLPALVGGVSQLPDQVELPGISLVVEPALFLQTLQELLPATQTVVTFYNADQSGWVPLLEKAASEHHLVIQPIAVRDTETAVRELGRILKTVDPRTTALWFTEGTISLNRELILPYVLEETWKRRLPAFSETVSHAKRGLLFAIYPDYYRVGAELGARIPHAASGPIEFSLTRAARFALNLRTAQNLGIPLRAPVIEKADVLFPAP